MILATLSELLFLFGLFALACAALGAREWVRERRVQRAQEARVLANLREVEREWKLRIGR